MPMVAMVPDSLWRDLASQAENSLRRFLRRRIGSQTLSSHRDRPVGTLYHKYKAKAADGRGAFRLEHLELANSCKLLLRSRCPGTPEHINWRQSNASKLPLPTLQQFRKRRRLTEPATKPRSTPAVSPRALR